MCNIAAISYIRDRSWFCVSCNSCAILEKKSTVIRASTYAERRQWTQCSQLLSHDNALWRRIHHHMTISVHSRPNTTVSTTIYVRQMQQSTSHVTKCTTYSTAYRPTVLGISNSPVCSIHWFIRQYTVWLTRLLWSSVPAGSRSRRWCLDVQRALHSTYSRTPQMHWDLRTAILAG